jgi:hypothetical protein
MILATAVVSGMLFFHSAVCACTAFMMADGQRVLVGANEDFNIPHTRVWFIPAENGRYGRVYFGYENWSPAGGMNDRGLFFDFFATKPRAVTKSKDKPKFPGPMTDTMAATCATVKEALDMFGKYNLEFLSKAQMFLADKTGDAAVIEGDEVIRKTGSYQVVTNFYRSKVRADRQPCEWYKPSCMQYKRAERMLTESGVASVPLFRNILEATHRDISFTRTLYSNIYDLKNGLVYVYYLHRFDQEVVLDLAAELKKGPHYYNISALFGKALKYGRRIYTHRAPPRFTIAYPSHFKVVDPVGRDEVLRVRCAHAGTPLFSVYVKDRPADVPLQDIGKRFFAHEISKLGSGVKMVSARQTQIGRGILANEVRFDWVTDTDYPVETLIVSTYRGDKLIFAAVSSRAHPEALGEFLYSLSFE